MHPITYTDKRQPYHLLAKVGGGYQLIDIKAWTKLLKRVQSRQRARARKTRRELVAA